MSQLAIKELDMYSLSMSKQAVYLFVISDVGKSHSEWMIGMHACRERGQDCSADCMYAQMGAFGRLGTTSGIRF